MAADAMELAALAKMRQSIGWGGLAYPCVSHGGIHEHQVFETGMTLRDHFAAQAIPALISQVTRAERSRDCRGRLLPKSTDDQEARESA